MRRYAKAIAAFIVGLIVYGFGLSIDHELNDLLINGLTSLLVSAAVWRIPNRPS